MTPLQKFEKLRVLLRQTQLPSPGVGLHSLVDKSPGGNCPFTLPAWPAAFVQCRTCINVLSGSEQFLPPSLFYILFYPNYPSLLPSFTFFF